MSRTTTTVGLADARRSLRHEKAVVRGRRTTARRKRTVPPPTSWLLTVDQLCAELHIARSTFDDWRAKGTRRVARRQPARRA